MTIFMNTHDRPISQLALNTAGQIERYCFLCGNTEHFKREIVLLGEGIIVAHCWECDEIFCLHTSEMMRFRHGTLPRQYIHSMRTEEARALPGMPNSFAEIPF